jgi:hypothetical protein
MPVPVVTRYVGMGCVLGVTLLPAGHCGDGSDVID